MTTTSSRSKKNKKRSSTSRSSKGRRRPAQRGGNMFIWIFLVALVALFGVIAFISRSGTADVEITNATVSGDELPQFGESPTDPAIGQPAPTISGTSITGDPITIEPGDGTPKAIAILAHWCPHCNREVPTVVDWAEAGNLPEGVEVIGVASGIDRGQPNFPPHRWLERENWDFPTVVDGNDAARQALGVLSYPGWILVDGEGNVVMRWSGETTPEQLTERIGQLAQAQ